MTEAVSKLTDRQRRYARRREVGGRLVAPVGEDAHGRPATYTNHGCRCASCTGAWAGYMRERREG